MFPRKLLVSISSITNFRRHKGNFLPRVDYKQGQIIERNTREYFYYIDFEGRLFLDNLRIKNFTTALRDSQFLKFFFQRLKINDSTRYKKEFPFIMVCGREHNFTRCEDTPVVFTQMTSACGSYESADRLTYNSIGTLATINFSPSSLYVNPSSGRIYHPAPEKLGSIGLVSSALSQQLADGFVWANGQHASPTHFNWKGTRHNLDLSWVKCSRVYGLNSVDPKFVSCDFH